MARDVVTEDDGTMTWAVGDLSFRYWRHRVVDNLEVTYGYISFPRFTTHGLKAALAFTEAFVEGWDARDTIR